MQAYTSEDAWREVESVSRDCFLMIPSPFSPAWVGLGQTAPEEKRLSVSSPRNAPALHMRNEAFGSEKRGTSDLPPGRRAR